MKKFLGMLLLLILCQGAYSEEKSDWEYSFIKALNHEERKEWSSAIQELEKSRALQKDNPLILKELGYCYAKQGNFEKARDCYERVLQLEPEDSNAKKNLKILLETKN